MAERHPRHDLDVRDRAALCLGEASNLDLAEPDVVENLWGDRGNRALYLFAAESKALGGPSVEACRVLANGIVAALADVLDDRGDRRADARIGDRRPPRGSGARLHVHSVPLSRSSTCRSLSLDYVARVCQTPASPAGT